MVCKALAVDPEVGAVVNIVARGLFCDYIKSQ